MQTIFVHRQRKGGAEKIIPHQQVVLKACKEHRVPLFIVELKPTNGMGYGSTIPELRQFTDDHEDAVKILKNKNSAFSSQKLLTQLTERSVQTLVLMGVNANFCVKETAIDALKYNYTVCTSPELISGEMHHSLDEEVQWYEEQKLFMPFGNLVSLLSK